MESLKSRQVRLAVPCTLPYYLDQEADSRGCSSLLDTANVLKWKSAGKVGKHFIETLTDAVSLSSRLSH